jgi:hypothetical protein
LKIIAKTHYLFINLYIFVLSKYWNTYFFVDGSNHASVNLMKVAWDEPLTWEPQDVSPDTMKILPISFGTEHKQLLSHLHVMVSQGYLAIPKQHDKVLTSLRTAYAKELSLDKEQTSYDDSLDSLRLALRGYKIS